MISILSSEKGHQDFIAYRNQGGHRVELPWAQKVVMSDRRIGGVWIHVSPLSFSLLQRVCLHSKRVYNGFLEFLNNIAQAADV